jgi:hypothetical protein
MSNAFLTIPNQRIDNNNINQDINIPNQSININNINKSNFEHPSNQIPLLNRRFSIDPMANLKYPLNIHNRKDIVIQTEYDEFLREISINSETKREFDGYFNEILINIQLKIDDILLDEIKKDVIKKVTKENGNKKKTKNEFDFQVNQRLAVVLPLEFNDYGKLAYAKQYAREAKRNYMGLIYNVMSNYQTPSSERRRKLIYFIINLNIALDSNLFKIVAFKALTIGSLDNILPAEQRMFLIVSLNRLYEDYVGACDYDCDFLMGDIILDNWSGPGYLGIGEYTHASLSIEDTQIVDKFLTLHCVNDGCNIYLTTKAHREDVNPDDKNKMEEYRLKEEAKYINDEINKKLPNYGLDQNKYILGIFRKNFDLIEIDESGELENLDEYDEGKQKEIQKLYNQAKLDYVTKNKITEDIRKKAKKEFAEKWKIIETELKRKILRIRFKSENGDRKFNIMAGILGLSAVISKQLDYDIAGACKLAVGSCNIGKLKDESVYEKLNNDIDKKIFDILSGKKLKFACSSFVILIWQMIFYLFTETSTADVNKLLLKNAKDIDNLEELIEQQNISSKEGDKLKENLKEIQKTKLAELKNKERLKYFPLNYKRCLPHNIFDVLILGKTKDNSDEYEKKENDTKVIGLEVVGKNPNWSVKLFTNWEN